MSAQVQPPVNIVDRTMEDRTDYLCQQSGRVLMRRLPLAGDRFPHRPAETWVTRWHQEHEHQGGIDIGFSLGGFHLTQSLSPADARVIAAALLQAADEQELAMAAQQEAATC